MVSRISTEGVREGFRSSEHARAEEKPSPGDLRVMKPKDWVKRGEWNVSHVASTTSLIVNSVVNTFNAAVDSRPALGPRVIAKRPIAKVGTKNVKHSLPQISHFTFESSLSQVILRGCSAVPWPADSRLPRTELLNDQSLILRACNDRLMQECIRI